MIIGIQRGTERAVGSMSHSQDRANGTLELARGAADALEVIAEAIAAINERNLVNIRDLATQTSAGAHQTSAAAQDLSRLAVRLNGMVGRFRP